MKKLVFLAVGIVLSASAFAATTNTNKSTTQIKKVKHAYALTESSVVNPGIVTFRSTDGLSASFNTEANLKPESLKTPGYEIKPIDGTISYGLGNGLAVLGTYQVDYKGTGKVMPNRTTTTPNAYYYNNNIGGGLQYTIDGYQLGTTLNYLNWTNYNKGDVNNGIAEGFNNKIKVIKRMSYGIKCFRRLRMLILHKCA